MRKFGKFGTVLLATLTLVGALGVPAAAPAPVVFATTPIAGWSTNGPVRAVLIVGDTVYAGGDFTQVRGPGGTPTVARSRLAAFDVRTGALRTGFSADTNAVVESLASDGNRLFVGGDFTTVKGVNRARLAAVDLASGNVITTWNAGATSHVYALRTKANRLYVGGAFGTLGGIARARIGAVSTATGAVDPTFNPIANSAVHALAVSPDGATVYAGGDFTTIGGGTRGYIAPLLATTGALSPLVFQFPIVTGSIPAVRDLDISPGGDRLFGALEGFENRVTAWSTRTGQQQWFYQVDGDTQAVRYYNGNVYFGFHEGAINDPTVRLLVADAATGQLVNSHRPTINSFFGVWDIDVSAQALAVGGEFTNFNGVSTQGLALLPPGSTDPVPPTPPGTPTVTASAATSITLAWTAGTDNVGVAGYRVLRNGFEVGYPTGTTFTDTDLAPSSDSTYTVQTVDAAGNFSTPSNPVLGSTGVVLIPAGDTWRYLDNGANLGTAWRANAFNDATWASGPAELGYGDTDEATTVSFGPDPNNKHRATYFRRSFTVTDPATVGALTLRLVRDDGAVVYLNGTEIARSNMPAGTITNTTYASVNVDGPEESQWFTFNPNPSLLVSGTNTIAVEVHQQYRSSSDLGFNLALEAARSQVPATPAALQVAGVTGNSVSLAWNPPEGAATITGYRVYRDGALVASPASPSFTDAGLTSTQTYSYTVTAIDNRGLESLATAPVSATTLDVIAPSPPTGLAAPTVSATQIVLTWGSSTDNIGVTGYDVVRDGNVIATVADPGYTDTSIAPSQTYAYTVRARDAAANVSTDSDPISAHTPDGSDLIPPSVPEGLRVLSRAATTATIAWDASTDNVGVASYVVSRNGIDVATVAATSFADTLLTPGASSTYRVRAVDALSNTSDPSVPLSVATHLATETLFGAGSAWRYTDDGIDRGTLWRATAYDDTPWKSGPGILGYANNNETTVMWNGGTVSSQRWISHSFRKNIVVSDLASVSGVTLSVLRDDGVVVYVNGVEAFRDNMPSGTSSAGTFAVNNIDGAAETAYTDFTIPPSLLVEGNNVIAVSVHQSSRSGAGDLSFDARMTARYP